ncbi:MAG: biotin/lipoyl-binding protein, partial [Chloroflexi bacterium]|nr:biotin/lipoyl-binding protein [Chloroflexota bacterium]
MPTDFLLPDLGEDIDEADVTKVYVSEGDPLTLEQAIIEIETEKATLDVPSSVEGTVTSVHVSLGDTIHPGQVILTISETVATGQAPAAKPEAPTPEPDLAPTSAPEPAPTAPPARVEAEPAAPPQPVAAEAAAPAAVSGPPGAFAAPSVRKFAREVGV